MPPRQLSLHTGLAATGDSSNSVFAPGSSSSVFATSGAGGGGEGALSPPDPAVQQRLLIAQLYELLLPALPPNGAPALDAILAPLPPPMPARKGAYDTEVQLRTDPDPHPHPHPHSIPHPQPDPNPNPHPNPKRRGPAAH